jgi:quercetin dioxygenase-like cupin family protein
MKRLQQYDSLVIHDLEEEKFHLPTHAHTYYEIIYVFKGSGVHLINNNRFRYVPGDLFLLSPEDTHHFDIAERSRFIFIKFTDSYFSPKKSFSQK